MTVYALGDHAPKFPESGHYWIAPNAQVMGAIILEENASVWFGAVLRAIMSRLPLASTPMCKTAR